MIDKLIHTAEGKLEIDDPFMRVGTRVQMKPEHKRVSYQKGEITEECIKKYETTPPCRNYAWIKFEDSATPLQDNRENLMVVDD